ncbi:hypothetical protein EDD17DRAFT_1875262 [Pisolithus thermaeus]|nr:hypothetical protein EV401DRAFT_2209685 [Pisolithus croceorrhizus]KAI6160896.1 hypothetical protein EDD17DRAFT_1875262 [Pisolithus thermaeus]
MSSSGGVGCKRHYHSRVNQGIVSTGRGLFKTLYVGIHFDEITLHPSLGYRFRSSMAGPFLFWSRQGTISFSRRRLSVFGGTLTSSTPRESSHYRPPRAISPASYLVSTISTIKAEKRSSRFVTPNVLRGLATSVSGVQG